MSPVMKEFKNVEAYIAASPASVQPVLHMIRSLILKHAPEAAEGISYGMPGYKLNGKPLVYFADQKKHIGFYATPTGHAAFADELEKYKHGKGSVQFPKDQPIPYDLIERMIIFRVRENRGG
jgi:uncharacterized protein YdhG (YjbR/CyaY superfamily)